MIAEGPPPGAAPDWTISQDWASYSAQDHASWDRLFARQAAMLRGRVVPEFLEGLEMLRMSKPGIPDFEELNEWLMATTAGRCSPCRASCPMLSSSSI